MPIVSWLLMCRLDIGNHQYCSRLQHLPMMKYDENEPKKGTRITKLYYAQHGIQVVQRVWFCVCECLVVEA